MKPPTIVRPSGAQAREKKPAPSTLARQLHRQADRRRNGDSEDLRRSGAVAGERQLPSVGRPLGVALVRRPVGHLNEVRTVRVHDEEVAVAGTPGFRRRSSCRRGSTTDWTLVAGCPSVTVTSDGTTWTVEAACAGDPSFLARVWPWVLLVFLVVGPTATSVRLLRRLR
jgi:hypothetical protein